jgi:hypothetical protein
MDYRGQHDAVFAVSLAMLHDLPDDKKGNREPKVDRGFDYHTHNRGYHRMHAVRERRETVYLA